MLKMSIGPLSIRPQWMLTTEDEMRQPLSQLVELIAPIQKCFGERNRGLRERTVAK